MKTPNLLSSFIIFFLVNLLNSILYYAFLLQDSQIPMIIISIVILLFYITYYVKIIGRSDFHLHKNEVLFLCKSLIGIFILSFLVQIISHETIVGGNIYLYKFLPEHFYHFFNEFPKYIVLHITVLVIPPIGEEIAYRRLLQEYFLQKNRKPVIAIVCTAIVFSLSHLDPPQFLYHFLSGCFYGIVYYKYRNLLINILCHLMFNINATILKSEECVISAPGVVIYVIALIIFVFLVRSILKDEKTK